MKGLISKIEKRGNGVCATLPKALIDVMRIPFGAKFEIETKTVKGVKTIILREVE